MLVTLLCAHEPCSKPFSVLPYQARTWKYCSPACYHSARITQTHEAFAQRFWSKVLVCQHGRTCTECCWTWTGATHGQRGYGNFRATPFKAGNVSAHVASWFLKTGEWPEEGWFVCHTCDNNPCVQYNSHLFLGTHIDNMQDMINKGRQGHISHPERIRRGDNHPARLHPERMARGERNGMRLHPESLYKITEAQVAEACALYATGQWTLAQLGARYNITGQAIGLRMRRHKASHGS